MNNEGKTKCDLWPEMFEDDRNSGPTKKHRRPTTQHSILIKIKKLRQPRPM